MNDLINQFDNEYDSETKLSDAILDIIESESAGILDDRRVSDDAVFEVASRALVATETLNAESRYFAVLREVSSFVTLAIHGSRPNNEVLHADLLPAGHPQSTAVFDISEEEYRRRSAMWNAADPRITDDYARTVVASAFNANPNSPEFLYATTRLRSLEPGRVPLDLVLSPIIAAFGSNPYAGKNNRANRSARAKAQRRDRFGRFAYQGGGLRFYVRMKDGSTASVVGRYAGNGSNPNNIEVEISGVEGIKDGIYSVPTNYMEFIEAVLPEHVVSKITPMAPALDVPVLNYKDLKRQALPSFWSNTKVPAALRKLKNAVNPDQNLISGDGYQVGVFNKLTPETKAYLQDVVSEYSPKVVGDNGTSQLSQSLPVYQIVSSMSGENKVIGLAQNWNDIQNILADEDEANPDNYNQPPIARLPKADVDNMEDFEKPYTPDQERAEAPVYPEEEEERVPLADMIPGDWEQREPNHYYSPDGRFSVTTGMAYAGDRLIETEDDYGNPVIESEPVIIGDAFTVVSDPNTVEPEVLGIAFNWQQAQKLMDLVADVAEDVPDQSAIENEKDANSGLEQAVKAIADWQENPNITENDIDQMISEGKDPMDVIQDILTPVGAATRKDADPIDTIKGILFPAQALDPEELNDVDQMLEPYDKVEQWLEPTLHYSNRTDAYDNPTQDQLKALRIAYTAHKHNLALQQAVEAVLADPQNFTVAQTLSLVSRINLQPLEKKGPNGYAPFKAVPAQRKALQAILKNRAIPEAEVAALTDQLHYLTQTAADAFIKKYNDDEKYPPLEREPSIRQRKAAGEVNLPEPEWVTSEISEEDGGPSLGQMLKVETAFANRDIPEKERKAFIKNHPKYTYKQFQNAITKFESYPYVGKYQPKYLETLMGKNGATPRMLAAFERIFEKPIVSPEEQEALLQKIPYMTKHAAGVVLGNLKAREDDYDIEVVNSYLRAGIDPEAEGLRIPESYMPPFHYEDAVGVVKDSLTGVTSLIIDFAKLAEINQRLDERNVEEVSSEPGPDVVHDGTDGTLAFDEELLRRRAAARRKDAKNMRKSILRAAGDLTLAMLTDRRITPQGRRLMEAAIADLHLLRSSLDLRRRKNLSAQDVTEFLHMVRDGIGNPVETETYGKLRNPSSAMLGALHEAAYAVHDISWEYKAGYRPEFDNDIDNMESNVEMRGPVPEGWTGSTGYWTDPTGRYTILNDYITGNALYDGKFNPVKPNKIAYVDNWKDALDTIWYNENIERLPDFTADMISPTSPNFHAQSWRAAKLLEDLDPTDDIDTYEGEVPDMGRINAPAFYGPAFQELPDNASYQDVMDYLNSKVKEFYVFDFETTGLRKLNTPHIKNDPVQIAIAKVVGGQVVDSTSFYMNPGSPLSDWSAGREANSEGLKGPDGLVLTDGWLATQMSKREAMEKFRSFVPDGAVLSGHNGLLFDMEVLNRTMREAGLPEYQAGGFIDTYGLATYAVPSPRNNPNGVAEDQMPKRHTLTELGRFFGLDTEGMHNAENDVRATGELLFKILEYGAAGKAIAGDTFDLSDAANGFNFPKYKALAAAYKKKATQWISDNASELIANGVAANVEELLSFLKYPFNATGASSTTSGSMSDDPDPTLSESVITSAPRNMLPPTDAQLASVQRRMDIPGVFSEAAKENYLQILPTLNRESIGSYVQLADVLELKHRMRQGLSIDNMRIPAWFADEVIGYKPTVAEEKTSDDIDEMSEEASKDKVTMAQVKKSLKKNLDLKKVNFKKKLTKEQEDIVTAAVAGYDVRVLAMAGVGKTSTVEAIAAAQGVLNEKLKQAYLVFNSNIAEEARERLPESVEIRTSDSLSFNAKVNAGLKEKFQYQNGSPKHTPVSLTDNSIGLLNYLEILFPEKQKDAKGNMVDSGPNILSNLLKANAGRTTLVTNKDGSVETKPIPKEVLVMEVGEMVRAWAISGDDEMSEKHYNGVGKFAPEILEAAKFLWSQVLAPKDENVPQIEVEFEHMFKNWALTKPNWAHIDGYGKSVNGFRQGAPHVVYLDEAQDINDVFYQMLTEQSSLHNNGIQFIIVGDPNQSLYGFRGAKDAVSRFPVDITLPLSMSFRSGEAIANAANLFLDIKYGAGKGPRLVGNPDIKSEVVEAGTLKDYDAVLVNTNKGALDAIITVAKERKGAVIGVVPNFRNDLGLLVQTVRWLATPAAKRDPKFRPKKLLPDLASFTSWAEVQKEYELHKSPALGKYLSILNMVQDQLKEDGNTEGPITMWSALKYIEKLSDELRVRSDGFVVPDKIGTSGKLGNAIKYEIKGGKILLHNDSFLKSWQLKPYQGLKNNKGILKYNGFVPPQYVPGGKPVYHYEAKLIGNGKKQLEDLVKDLSGKTIDVDITTVHRGKGLEYPKVKIWNDFPSPKDSAEELAEKQADAALPENAKERAKILKQKEAEENAGVALTESASELNKYYTAFTRAMNVLDPGSLDWIFKYAAEKAASSKPAVKLTKAQEETKAKAEKAITDKKAMAEGEFGQVAKGVTYEVSRGNLIVAGKTDPYKKLLEGMGFVYREDGKVWYLRIGKSADAAEALGKRMKVIEALRKRINLS